jgi:hypothetical protein
MKAPLLLLLSLHLAAGQFPPVTKVPTEFGTDTAMWARWHGGSLLRDTLIDEALGHLQARARALEKLDGPVDWAARREYVRWALNQSVGRGLPPLAFGSAAEREADSPLNAKKTNTHRFPALGNATLEMLHFESRPDFFVTGGLWTPPADAPGRLPDGRRAGVLMASGHSCQAWRRYDYPSFFDYQFAVMQLVRQGFVVFAYDPPSQA